MVEPITVSNLTQLGRANVEEIKKPRIGLTHRADFSGATDLTYDFAGGSQRETFGYAKSMFIDNSTNPSSVEVIISSTQMFFTIPAYSEGIYIVDTTPLSTVRMVTDGGASRKSTITFYNYVQPTNVYYSYGSFNNDKPVRTYGTMAEGDTVATELQKDPIFVGGIDRDTGIFHGLAVDSQGRLATSNGGVAGGSVLTPMGNMTAVGGTDGTFARLALTSATGAFQVQSEQSITATRTQVLAAVTDTSLVAQATRRGLSIFNNSTASMYLGIGTPGASPTNFSLIVLPGGYYEATPTNRSQAHRAYWDAVNGDAQITVSN